MEHLFLIGFMGTGKSTLGKVLAERTGRPFIDLDERIEAEIGMKLPEYFERYGEAAFREQEHELLDRITLHERIAIIACGGGTPCSERNRSIMEERGIRILLSASPEELAKRLANEKEGRPKLKEASPEWIREELARRKPCYEGAELEVKVEEKSTEGAVEEVLRFYSK